MCMNPEDMDKLKEDHPNGASEEQWQILHAAIARCKWVAHPPSNDGDWIIDIECEVCGTSLSGVAGGVEVAFEAYTDNTAD